MHHRKANVNDLKEIVELLSNDILGNKRENISDELEQCYIDAFHQINKDSNQYLMVVEKSEQIIGTCHLSLIPSLTFGGSLRMQIEAVRVHQDFRGKKIGEWMINESIKYGKLKGASIIQLTTNKERVDALKFYEKLGFTASHEGMKLYFES